MRFIASLSAVGVLASVAWGGTVGTPPEHVQFAPGATTAVIKGKLRGEFPVDYRVRAGAGQSLTVTMTRSNRQSCFDVNPPGSDVPMFVGSSDPTAESFASVLPDDGDYTLRVYLMRSAARRNEASGYTLTIGLTGSALAPLPASKAALLPGTSFHASGRVMCVRPGEKGMGECKAFVTRRGVDGTATVEIPLADSGKRRILFVKGKPVASDSPSPLTFTHEGHLTTVNLGADEWYDIPDALLTGG